MNVCLIGDGRSVHLRRWSEWLRGNGCRVSMLSVLPMGDVDRKSYDESVQVKTGTGILSMMRAVRAVRREVARISPDVVHGQYLTSGGYLAAKSRGRFIVTSAWGSDVYVDAVQSSAKRRLVVSALKGSHHVFADTDHLCEATRKVFPAKSISKVVFGIDPEKFRPRQELRPKKFTFISIRFTRPIYNPSLILEAFEMVAETTDSNLLIQEVLDDNQELKRRIDGSSARARIGLYPYTPHDEMPALINSANFAISAPDTDSSPASMLESMACGVPAIASDIPQNREWIEEGVNGYLFKLGSSADLAAKMTKAAGERGIGKMGESARAKVVQNASFDSEMKKALLIYEKGAR